MQNFSKNPEFIKNLFNNISPDYDKLNDIMSFGLHRKIKKDVINILFKLHSSPFTILDLCTGTGDIARLLRQKFPNAQVTGVDFSPEMLEIARGKCGKDDKGCKCSNIEFIEVDCTQLPFEDNSFDICTISFGLRNIENIEQAISEIYRVLKPGGIFVNIDLGKPNKFFNLFFKPYMYIWVAMLGKIFHGDETPYKYLAQSNENFPHPLELEEIYKKQEFSNIKHKSYLFGQIAAQFSIK